MSLPPPRQELPDLLLDAIRRRDAAATARLIRQWAHRHGVTSLETFRTGGVIGQEGPEAGDWLRQQLEGGAMAPGTEAPAGVDEAFAALDMAFSTPPKPGGQAPASAVLSSGVTSLPEASRLCVLPSGAPPAPAPSTLADLRSWLSGAPQHRRAG